MLVDRSSGFRHSLPDGIVGALSGLVRSMNFYYSNLIEGHRTHPVDIEKALKGDYSNDPERRNLQREAPAHIAVQKWIDDGGLRKPTTREAICEIHRRFFAELPEDLLIVEDPVTHEHFRIIPGQLRSRPLKWDSSFPSAQGLCRDFLTASSMFTAI